MNEIHAYVSPQADFFSYLENLVQEKRQSGCLRTAEIYESAGRRLRRFCAKDYLPFACFDAALVESFDAYLTAEGLARNTISFYLRTLRVVYRRMSLRMGRRPDDIFIQVFTGTGRTRKRAIDRASLARLRRLDLTDSSELAFVRDLFLFSFYTRGMAFVDMAYLRKSDLQGGVLTYCRRKTHQRLMMQWEPEMQQIVRRWPNRCTPYLLPIILREDGTERRQYRNALHRVNHRLKQVAHMAGCPSSLSMYVARHSWASIAHACHIPLGVISEGMGHDSERTTQIYIAQLDASVIDRANRKILSELQ